MILPLSVRRVAGTGVASGLGGRHANYHMPLCAPGAAAGLTPIAMQVALRQAGRALGADVFSFVNLPPSWGGWRNPLDLGGPANASDAYRLTLGADPEAVLERALSKDARKKLRQKERHLAAIGPVSHRVARVEGEARAYLAAFFAQKAARFRDLGLPDPFAGEGVRRFLVEAALAGLEAGEPAVEVHALLAGERIVAVFAAAVNPRRCSGMVISFDAEAAVARCSPGDLLVSRVIRAHCLAGREAFDLGVGEARYKNAFCPDAEPLLQVTVPVSAKGAVYARSQALAAAAKRAVKRNPRLFAFVTRLRIAAAL
jgi:CelD/BcsL family acetyltransferase involved in cellulose biosynthesis